jgi:putative transcriptional regulator
VADPLSWKSTNLRDRSAGTAADLRKHDASFEAATYVFDDPMRFERDDVLAEGEYRSLVTGWVDDMLLTVVYSMPEDNLCRIISARLLPMSATTMSKTYFTRKRGAPFRFSEEERRRLKTLSDAEIEARALSAPDNPPLTKEELKRMVLAREVRLIREKTGLSQPQFAARFHIGLARFRDFEQGRSEPDFVVRVFMKMILEDPAKVDRLVKIVERQGAVTA